MANFQVFDPTTEAKEQALNYVPRPDSLRNLRIGLVENTKYNSDTLLLKIADILDVLGRLGLSADRAYLVMVNGEVVPQERHARWALGDNDELTVLPKPKVG